MTMQFRWYSMVNSYNKSYADFGNGVGIQTDNLRTTDTDWFRTTGAVNNIRRMAEINEGGFALYYGNRWLICRPKFEEYLLKLMENPSETAEVLDKE